MFRSSYRRWSVTKGVLRNFAKFTGKHLCQSLFFNKVAGLMPEACNFIKKTNLAQVFSCESCEISMNTFCRRTPPVAASVCCRRKVAAVKIEKLKAFIIKYYNISKTYLYSSTCSIQLTCHIFIFLSIVFSHQFSIN